MQAPSDVTFRIRRFDPARGTPPWWDDFTLPYVAGMTVLDGLRTIKETRSPTLAWRSSCRMGVCGSCGMFINGHPRLACNTQITELDDLPVVVAPLPNFDIIRDLVPDLRPMFDAHVAMHPHIIREDTREMYEPTAEYYQTTEDLEAFLQFTYCIKCGCCMAACPTCATDPAYSGPMPLAQAHRYNADSRDGGFNVRRKVLAGEAGPWKCHYAGECSQACPKGVDPARAIQMVKRQLVFAYLRLYEQPCPSKVVPRPTELRRHADVPEAPAPTAPR
ncbi:MAG: succinate dehydrogenase iron-sulfur subunit [Acidobacteria bacterium]|nr:succinate dehydrogenase iron-sulfur subunit [Acidobacteriota bacterium]